MICFCLNCVYFYYFVMWFLKLYNVVFRIISFVKNVKTELDFKLILSCASASYADSFFSLFSLLIQISYFPLHFGQISSIMDIGFSASKR